jgi:hypothetical protein
MICKYCRYAGQQSVHMAQNPAVLPLIEAAHGECPGETWCDCQHFPPGSAGPLTGKPVLEISNPE